MVTKPRIDTDELVLESNLDFRVHRRVYTDPEIFELEMEKIFHRSWVYVAHETELPDGGNYKSTTIGRQPVIITRNSDDGRIYGFINSCRHRGSTVCQQEYGTSNYFRCAYHGWVYNNRGELVGLPSQEGYGSEFDIKKMGLLPLPRMDTYRGFIFASLSSEGPSLREHLGNAMPYIDKFVEMGPQGIEVKAGTHKFGYDANWKWQLDNTVDGYHAQFTHQSYFEIVAHRLGKSLPRDPSAAHVWDLGNGHAVLDILPGGINASDQLRGMMTTPGYNMIVFPNLALLFAQVRRITPIAVNRTEVTQQPVLLKGVAPEINTRRVREHEDFYGPGGFAAPDDWEMYGRCQKALATGDMWVILSRGLEYEKVAPDGSRYSTQDDESSQRAVYRQWKRIMAS
ncbi:MAG TPA: Rieske 2Fe-2S domain-containing protein [Dehalococcoidia bacterium]|nr:Rieske 2Fe-2S domain-containing protein [Dehalococcoidia bacterium]